MPAIPLRTRRGASWPSTSTRRGRRSRCGRCWRPTLAPLIAFGASPRATLALAHVAKGFAFIQGRAYVVPEDVKSIAADVLRHRIVLSYEAAAENVTSDMIIEQVLGTVAVP